MNYRDQVFLIVAELQSFSKAAKKLFISQPAVTKHIKELETSLELTLFNRKGGKISLTRAGQLVFNRLKRIKRRYDELEFEISKLKHSYSGNLSIGASSTVIQYLLPQLIIDFHNKYPDIHLCIKGGNSSTVEKELENRAIELAIVDNNSNNRDFSYKPLFSDEIVLVGSTRGLFDTIDEISFEDLTHLPLIMRESGSGSTDIVIETLRDKGLPSENLKPLINLSCNHAIKEILMNFDGLAFLPKSSIQRELNLKILKTVHLEGVKIKANVKLALPHGTPTANAAHFMRFLQNYKFHSEESGTLASIL